MGEALATPALEITTRELVRAANEAYADPSFDAQITSKIAAVSDHAQKYMGRHLKAVDRRTGIYEMRAGRRTLTLLGMPIASVSYIKAAPSRADLPLAQALTADQYSVIAEQGQIYFEAPFAYGPVYVEASYIGGMAESTEDFIAKYPDIAEAATNEVVNRLNRKKTPEGNLAVPFGTSMTHTKQMGTLEDFERALDTRVRATF